jgi:hypothetical protein
MIEDKELPFFNEKITFDNKAVFKDMRINRYVWDSLFIYDEEVRAQEDIFEEFIKTEDKKVNEQIYKKYLKNILTGQ